MENRINIAELLKDCPKGMELDCTMYDNMVFDSVSEWVYPIKLMTKDGSKSLNLTSYGCTSENENAKCVIFPKGKTSWEGFQRPFKDGDIVATDNGLWIGITEGGKAGHFIPTYCVIKSDGTYEAYFDRKEKWSFNRLATEGEKQKLFDAIKANGYKWNPDNKTLEKLPKFKVGDRIQWYGTHVNHPIRVVKSIECDRYRLDNGGYIKFGDEHAYKLLKFDINTLKAFDKVLVAHNKGEWHIQFFEKYSPKSKLPFICIGGSAYQKCVPYEENKHLMDTTDDCDDYFKIWE